MVVSSREVLLFTKKEQSLLMETRPDDLAPLCEDDLVDLLSRVRRARNKYSDLHRRQDAATVERTSGRYGALTSNARTLRKAEILEDAVSRVARFVSRAARANAEEVRRSRIDAARRGRTGVGEGATRHDPAADRAAGDAAPSTRAKVDPARRGSVSARGKRAQARKDARTGG